MLNFAGVVTAKRMLSWWRIVVFTCFAFAAVVTPTPDPFGMTFLAIALSLLYFIAAAIAYVNDRRKGRGKEIYAGLDDDEVSPLEDTREPVAAGDRIEVPTPVAKPLPLDRGYDDVT
jgi:sec-independent protein translocase protein TatC